MEPEVANKAPSPHLSDPTGFSSTQGIFMYICGVFFNLHAMSLATCVRMFRVFGRLGGFRGNGL